MFEKIKANFEVQKRQLKTLVDQQFSKASDKLHKQVKDCKTKSNIKHCCKCEDFRFCPIKRYEQ